MKKIMATFSPDKKILLLNFITLKKQTDRYPRI